MQLLLLAVSDFTRQCHFVVIDGVAYPIGWAEQMEQCIYMPITLSHINRFLKFFHCRNQEKCVVTLEISPHFICVATLPGEMSDIAFKLAI